MPTIDSEVAVDHLTTKYTKSTKYTKTTKYTKYTKSTKDSENEIRDAIFQL